MEIIDQLKLLSGISGVSGNEFAASEAALVLLKKYTEKCEIDDFFNVIGFIGNDPAFKTVLLDAHIDEIGLIITSITDDGYVKVSSCGGVDKRTLHAQQVILHGKQNISGVICTMPPHVSKDDKVPNVDELYIDTGFSKETLMNIISIGDIVTVESGFGELLNGRVCGKALDDRCGVVAILHALELLRDKKLNYNIVVLFSAQEEVGERGAKISAYNIETDEAIIVDVTYACTPDSNREKCGEMGKGVMIGISPSLSSEMTDKMLFLAEKNNIPYQYEVMAGKTGTNADEIGTSKCGVKTSTLSIPLRYMHTAVEMLQISDIESVSELIAAYIGGTV